MIAGQNSDRPLAIDLPDPHMLAATEPGHYEARATAFIERGSDWAIHAFVMGYRYNRTRPLERSREINMALVRKVLLNETEQRANGAL